MVLSQLAKNGVVTIAEGYFLGEDITAQISSAKATVPESTKADMLLDMKYGQKYNHLKDDLRKEFSNLLDKYPLTVERAIHLFNTYKIKFDYTKKGVNLNSNEEEVAFKECR